MPSFIKKPVLINAERFNPDQKPWPEGVEFGLVHGLGECHHVMTLEGAHLVRPGDFIITGVKGERYPCRADIFLETYDPADPDAADVMAQALIETGGGRAFCIECERLLAAAESPREHSSKRSHRVAMVASEPVVDPQDDMIGRFYPSLMRNAEGKPMMYLGPVAEESEERMS